MDASSSGASSRFSFLEPRMLAALFLIGVSFFVFKLWRLTHSLPLPPNPRTSCNGRVLVGPSTEPWKKYADWSKHFGPLLLLSRVGRPVIVINTTEAALSILGRISCQSKPRWPMAELLGRQMNVGFQDYGIRLRKSRKLLHASLCPDSIHQNWSFLLDSCSRNLVHDFLVQPDRFYEDVHKNIQELVVCFAYGKKPDTKYLQLARQVMQETSVALQPGRWMVNLIPALSWVPAWMPGAGFHRWARNARDAFFKMTREPFDEAKADISRGRARPSFVKHALQNVSHDSPGDAEDIIMCAAGSLFSAGTETLIGAVLTFLALMIHHPEVQVRAYDEICCKIGRSRLPQSADASILAYIECIIQEVHRFNPAIPLVTHSNTVEEHYKGFRIPCRTWLMANVWAILHDETAYPEPERFNPERFLPSERSSSIEDPRKVAFGFGRRRCPGVHFAEALLFLIVSRVLALFEVLPEASPPAPIEFSTGLVPTPVPFRARFKLRQDAKALLASLID